MDALDADERTPLAGLCRIEPEFVQNKVGGEEAFKILLDRGKEYVNLRSGNKGLTPLHYAAIAGNYPLVRLLIENGAEVNAQASDGYTALGYVEKRTSKKGAQQLYGSIFPLLRNTIKVLLEAGAVRRAHADIAIEAETDSIIYMRNNVDGTYQMRAATVPAMIDRLTHHVVYSAQDVLSFLLQYQEFTTPMVVLNCLKSRFFSSQEGEASDNGAADDKAPSPLDVKLLGERRSVLCFLETWLSRNGGDPSEFRDKSSGLSEVMGDFAAQIMDANSLVDINDKLQPLSLVVFAAFVKEMHPNWEDRWREGFVMHRDKRRSSVASVCNAGVYSLEYQLVFQEYKISDRPCSSKANKLLGVAEEDEFKFLELTSKQLAQQLTLLMHAMFCSIPVEEFVDERYKKDDTGPNFQKMKRCTNRISFVLISAILSEEDISRRASVIVLLIKTAENCLDLDNFDTFLSIMNVLGSSSVHRLKQTWMRVHKVIPRKWQAMQRASAGMGRKFEAEMNSLEPPCVPCLGLVLRMLINMGEEPLEVNNKKGDPLINFHRLRKKGGAFHIIRNAKKATYKFAANRNITRAILGAPKFATEEGCWERSLLLETKVKK